MAEYASALPERLPHATFKVLAGVGHVPMIHDPRLVAHTILAATGATKEMMWMITPLEGKMLSGGAIVGACRGGPVGRRRGRGRPGVQPAFMADPGRWAGRAAVSKRG